MLTGLQQLRLSFQTTHICFSNANRNNVPSSKLQYQGLAWQSFTQRREDEILSVCTVVRPPMLHLRLCEAQLSFSLFLSPLCPQVLYFSGMISAGHRQLGLRVRSTGALSNLRNGQDTLWWATMIIATSLWTAYIILLKFMVESFWKKEKNKNKKPASVK